MRFLRILNQRLSADIRRVVDAPAHDFEILVNKVEVDSMGMARRPFVLRADGNNIVRKLFFVYTVFLEANLNKWQVAPQDASYIFLPEFGRPVLINTETLEKELLPDQVMKGQFLANAFYGHFLMVLYSRSMMIVHLGSLVSACYTFNFELADARMLSERIILLTKEDGSTVKFDRYDFVYI
ncbi:MAG: hypothetical protein ACK5MK_09080 [Dysgonomonas sp.]